MGVVITVLVVFAVAGLILLAKSLRSVQQYERTVSPPTSVGRGSRW
ncbi:hypothetical protein [Streptomyces sp. 2A115]